MGCFFMHNKRAIIFANGQITSCDQYLKIIQPDDQVIAADGGAVNCLQCGISPHVVIGDFDSIPASVLISLHNTPAQMIHHPAYKDETDLELAVQFAIKNNCEEIIIFSALGGRWDMSLANLLLLSTPYQQANSQYRYTIKIIDGELESFFLPPRQKTLIIGQRGDIVSLIPLYQDVGDVTTGDLVYPLKNETLFFGSTRGISNVMAAETATVEYRDGLLLCMLTHHPTDDAKKEKI